MIRTTLGILMLRLLRRLKGARRNVRCVSALLCPTLGARDMGGRPLPMQRHSAARECAHTGRQPRLVRRLQIPEPEPPNLIWMSFSIWSQRSLWSFSQMMAVGLLSPWSEGVNDCIVIFSSGDREPQFSLSLPFPLSEGCFKTKADWV